MSDDMTIADYLRAAADELLTRGWYQGDFSDQESLALPGDGPKCVLGAIRTVACSDNTSGLWPPDTRTGRLIEEWIYEINHDIKSMRTNDDAGLLDCTGLAAWNDQPGRTADEVIALLLIAADEWEARHG